MEIGGLRGLTFDTGQDKLIQDLQYQDQMMQRKRMQDAALAQQLVGDIEFQKGSNPTDAALLQQEGQDLVKRLGQMVSERGAGWESDPNFLGALKFEKSKLTNSPTVLMSNSYQQAMSEWQKDMAEAAKNPEQWDMEALTGFQQKRDNYIKYRNPDGEEAAAKEGVKPLVYQSPQKFIDKDKYFADLGHNFAALDRKTIKNGNIGAWELVPNEQKLNEYVETIYASRPRQWDVQFGAQGIDPKQGIKAQIIANIPKKFDLGNPDPFVTQKKIMDYKAKLDAAANSALQGKPVDPYKEAIIKPGATVAEPVTLAKTFGSTIPYYYKDAKGNVVNASGDEIKYTGEIQDRNLGKGAKTGEKTLTGYVLKPIEWGIQQGYVSDPFWGEDKVKDDFLDEVEIVDLGVEDGKKKRAIKLKVMANVDANRPDYAEKFNKQVLTGKKATDLPTEQSYVEGQPQRGQSVPKGTRAQFKAKGWTDEMINQYSFDGSIIVE